MTALTLTLTEPPRQHADVSTLTPDELAGRSLDEVAAMELRVGNRRVGAGDLFEVSGDPIPADGAPELVIRNGCDRLDRIGHGMTKGTVIVEGDAGAYAGLAMAGGELRIKGSVGPFAASGMSGGEMWIEGNAGDFLAAAIPGDKLGMTGGVVTVAGSVGERAGDHMRRGVVLIEGDAGDYCASRMIAGSIVVLGKTGDFAGVGMKRGSLILFNPPQRMLATFNDCGTHRLPYLRLFMDYIRTFGGKFGHLDKSYDRVRRYAGDQGAGGKGEILVLES
jgi:formylmethanofuran dehydrogenase subunit C